MKLLQAISVIALLILLGSCGELSSLDDRVSINIVVSPATAGTVLTSGGDVIGNEVQFNAIANRNWQFAGWSGDIQSFDNPLVFELQDDVNLTANFSLFSNNYLFELHVSDGNTAIDLEFGQIPGATDIYDTGIDLESPPPPPGNTLYAWFENDNRNLIKDFRNAFTDQITWNLEFQPGTADSIWFEWTYTEESFSGTLQLTDPDGTFSINMFDENSIAIDPTEVQSLEIIYSFEE
jgi:hypothetical protein